VKYTKIVTLFLAVLIPLIAGACIQLVTTETYCDDCGNQISTLACQSGYSNGYSTCNPIGELIPCQGNDGGCYGTFATAVGHGTCHNGNTRSRAAASLTVSILVPTPEGGYRQSQEIVFPEQQCDGLQDATALIGGMV
jgi:hypothetical protein